MAKLEDIKITKEDFDRWMRERGYNYLMYEDFYDTYLDVGLAGLFFMNSPILFNFIFTQAGMQSERVSLRVRTELGRRVEEVNASKDYLEIKFYEPQEQPEVSQE